MIEDTHCVRPVPDLSAMRDVSPSDDQTVTNEYREEDCPSYCICTADWADCSYKNNNHRIASVPSKLPSFVTHLDMHNQGMTMMSDDACMGKSKLEEMILESNQINGISDSAFQSCVNMKILKLSKNQIYRLDGRPFQAMYRLQSLDLSENQLTQIPDYAFYNLTAVERVDLRDNYISAIQEDAFEGLTSMRFLYLERNRLSTIDVAWINKVLTIPQHHLNAIFLNNNDIQCDCKMKPLGEALKQPYTSGYTSVSEVIKANVIACSWPREYAGRVLSEVDFSNLPCNVVEGESAKSTSTSTTNFTMVLLGVILTVGGYFAYMKFQRYRVQAPQNRGMGGSIHTGGDGSNQPLMANEIYA